MRLVSSVDTRSYYLLITLVSLALTTFGAKSRSLDPGQTIEAPEEMITVSSSSSSGVLEIELHSMKFQVVPAKNESNNPQSYDLVGPATIPMARGNSLELNGHNIQVGQSGKLRHVMNPGCFTWTLPDGTNLTLDCSKLEKEGFTKPCLAWFYENGEYESGCALLNQTIFETDHLKIDVRWRSWLGLWPDGSLSFASKVSENSTVTIQGHTVRVRNHGEVAAHQNGRPRFFTIHPEDRLPYRLPNGKIVEFGSRERYWFSIQLDEKGMVSAGTPADLVEVLIDGKTHKVEADEMRFHRTGEPALIVQHPSQQKAELLHQSLFFPKKGYRAICLTKEGKSIDSWKDCQLDLP